MEDDNNMEFEEQIDFHMQKLEDLYLKKVEEADNQRYAKAFYRTTMFENNPNLPKNSYFFKILTIRFLHHCRMDLENAVLLTFDEVNDLKDRAETELLFCASLRNEVDEDEKIPLSYEDEKEYELILLEYHEIHNLLAYFLATKKLCDKYPEDKDFKPLSIEAPLSDKPRSNRIHPYSEEFSNDLQLLALHFIFIQVGSTPRSNHDVKHFSRMAHLLSNKPITEMDNSGLYGNAKKLFKNINGKNHLKNLKRILPIFDDCRLTTAIKTIKNEIEHIENNRDS